MEGQHLILQLKKSSFTTDIRCLPYDGEKIIEEYEKYAEMIDSQNKEIRPESNIAITRHHWVPGLKPENDGVAESLVRKLLEITPQEKFLMELKLVNFKKKDIVL